MTHRQANKATTRALLANEILALRREAREMRDTASWYRSKAAAAEKHARECDLEAERFERQLSLFTEIAA